MGHPLEEELKQFILEKRVSQIGDFTNAFISHPKIHHIHVIACKLLAADPAPFNQIFKTSKDVELIEELVQQYGIYPELAELFIPQTIVAVSVYKKMSLIGEAEELMEALIQKDPLVYCEEVFNFKDSLFSGGIGITIKKFRPTVTDPINWIEHKILTKQTIPSSDAESENRYNDFHFYKLNEFSFVNKDQEEEFFRIIESPKSTTKKFKTKKSTDDLSLFLVGYVQVNGVQFNIHLSSVRNLYQGLPTTNIALPDDFGKFLTDVVKEGAADQIADKIKDYLISYFPLVKEAKLIADLGEVVLKNTFKGNPDSLISVLEIHKQKIDELNINIKDYYINHYLVEEFDKFFNQKDFPLSAKQFSGVFETLYEYYIQNIKNFLPEEYEIEANKLIAAKPGSHADTVKFRFAYEALKNPEAKIKRKLFSKRQLT